MKVPNDEDLANHVSPESCGGGGNKTAEALTDSGGKRRRAIELRNHNFQGADLVAWRGRQYPSQR
jgi:hypothetical protein